jgi:ACR3 family arsenite transporter
LSFFERYLTVWVILCIVLGITLGKFAPEVAQALDGMAITVNGAPVVSVPIALCLFFMMYPIMVKIDFNEVVKAGKAAKPVALTMFINWAVKPFTMYAIASFFLGTLFLKFIGPDAVDLVKMPLGKDMLVGDVYGAGKVVLVDGMKMLEVPLWRSYLAGCILLGIAPCTAMVLVWGYLSKGNDGHTLVMVAINSLTMLLLFGFLGGFLLGVGKLPVPWEALLLSIGVYVALPLVTGYASRKWIIAAKGEDWFRDKFLHFLTPVTINAGFAVFIQRRDHRAESLDDTLDRDSAVRANCIDIRVGLWTVETFWADLRKRGTYGDDRCIKSLRGRYRDGRHALRSVVGSRARNRGWRSDRGAPDADAGPVLPGDAGLVSA